MHFIHFQICVETNARRCQYASGIGNASNQNPFSHSSYSFCWIQANKAMQFHLVNKSYISSVQFDWYIVSPKLVSQSIVGRYSSSMKYKDRRYGNIYLQMSAFKLGKLTALGLSLTIIALNCVTSVSRRVECYLMYHCHCCCYAVVICGVMYKIMKLSLCV